MTQEAVDKAIELVAKYQNAVNGFTGNEEKHSKIFSKRCAIICNQQEIDQLNRFADYWDLKNGEWYKDELIKLEEVKQAINQL